MTRACVERTLITASTTWSEELCRARRENSRPIRSPYVGGLHYLSQLRDLLHQPATRQLGAPGDASPSPEGVIMDSDLETTLATVAAIALPQFGVWCMVDIVAPDDSISRVAIVHPDAAMASGQSSSETNDRGGAFIEDTSGAAQHRRPRSGGPLPPGGATGSQAGKAQAHAREQRPPNAPAHPAA